MANDRSVVFWQEAIRAGQRFQGRFGGVREWQKYKRYYRHRFKPGVLPVNILFSIMRSVVAQTYPRDPRITLTPRRPGLIYQLHSRVLQSTDNWLIKELALKGELKYMIMDAFMAGTATGFNGYDSEYGWDPKKAESSAASLTQFDKKGYRLEYNAFINPGMPWFLRARPDDVVYPYGTTNKQNAEWIAMRKLRPVEDLKKDPKYTVPKDYQGSHVPLRTGPDGEAITDYQDLTDTSKENIERLWAEMWQIHDAKTGKIYAIVMDSDEFLRKDDDSMQFDGLPAETLTFNTDPDYIYGVPDARIIEPQLLELNEIRTQLMYHRRVDILKFLYKKNAIDANAINKLLDEDVKAAVECNYDGPLKDVVLPMPSGVGGILQDMAFCADLARQDVRETVGFSRVQQGEFQGKTHVTKSEVDHVMQRSDIRMDERRDAVADLIVNIVRKWNQTIFKHWTVPQVRDIIGPDGARWWVQFTGPEIAAEYTYNTEMFNAEPETPQSKKQDANEMARAWAEMNMGQVKAGAPVPTEIQRYFFSQYEGLDIDKLLSQQGQQQPEMGSQHQPIPMPIAAQMMQQRMHQGGRP